MGYKNHSVGYIFHSVGYKNHTVEQRKNRDIQKKRELPLKLWILVLSVREEISHPTMLMTNQKYDNSYCETGYYSNYQTNKYTNEQI